MCSRDVTSYWNECNKTNASLLMSHFLLDTADLPRFPEYSLVNRVFSLVYGGFSNIAGYGVLVYSEGKQLDKVFLTNSFSLITKIRRTTYVQGCEKCFARRV